MNGTTAVTSVEAEETPEKWEIAHQWRVAWRTAKWGLAGIAGFTLLLAAGQVFLFHQMFASIHPVAGGAFVAIAIALAAWLVGAPLYRFFRTPTIARPPDVDLSADGVDETRAAETNSI